MKSKKHLTRIVSVALAAALGCGGISALAGCSKGGKALVIMTQELNGLFNPFYSTAGTDMDVVGQTQISMFSTDDKGDIAYGDDEPVVVKDYMVESLTNGNTQYTFVLKPNIVFSDGVPLTMNDVLFNMYVYLDPAYTGSTTMYSTKILGLQAYRNQKNVSDDSSADDTLSSAATGRVRNRILELTTLFKNVGKLEDSDGYFATAETMRAAIADPAQYQPSSGYLKALWPNGQPSAEELSGGKTVDDLARAQLREDYDHALELFHEELENDFNAAKDSYQDAPYTPNEANVKFTDVVSFMFYEGYYEVEYFKDSITNKEDKNRIVKLTPQYSGVSTREQAIEYVYEDNIETAFDSVVTGWGTATTLQSEFSAKAKDVVLHEQLGSSEGLNIPNITGIRSLSPDHMPGNETGATSVTISHADGTSQEYKVAQTHNADGVPEEGAYDVLRITIKGTDPKAIWNFGFTVAPYHYYSDPSNLAYAVNIKENKFGVAWADANFQSRVIQGDNKNGVSKNKVPLGAGPYVATDRNDSDSPRATSFIDSNIVYYKSNPNFLMGEPKIKHMRYQVTSQSNALNQLEKGGVHFVEPQFTQSNQERIDGLKSKGIKSLSSWQLGYGYIGINAKYVPDINLRKAIMSAMDISLSLNYYMTGTADTINWPMSMVSWAYPRDRQTGSANSDEVLAYKNTNNGHDYTMFTGNEAAKAKIERYMQAAKVSAGNEKLHIKFTIAGSDLTDHPCYLVFKHAKDLLDACGWNIEINPDTYALTKLATGSLAVWAAAWGSTIDPDMYQVYHKNSSATSVYSWGYPSILSDSKTYEKENGILTELSKIIDHARETEDRTQRTKDYEEAMGLVLDLAVELPVYQRKTLYAYNAKVIDENTLPHDENGGVLINPYSSPLSRIWEVDFVK